MNDEPVAELHNGAGPSTPLGSGIMGGRLPGVPLRGEPRLGSGTALRCEAGMRWVVRHGPRSVIRRRSADALTSQSRGQGYGVRATPPPKGSVSAAASGVRGRKENKVLVIDQTILVDIRNTADQTCDGATNDFVVLVGKNLKVRIVDYAA